MELKVKVKHVRFPRPSVADDEPGNLWYVIDTDRGCISGECGWRPKDGEQLKLEGKMGTYQGQPQFKFTGAMIDIPVVPRDQLKYVAERTAGVGPAME